MSNVPAAAPAPTGARASAPRAELWRALGALCAEAGPGTAHIAAALGIPALSAEEHTAVFLLELPPRAGIHLGAEGMLGGDGAERAAGFFRALGLVPPAAPDHLTALFALAGHLAASEAACTRRAARARCAHARRALRDELLCSWLPAYLAVVADSAVPAAAAWAGLVADALAADRAEAPTDGCADDQANAASLPAALRDAPAPISADIGLHDLLDATVAPLRCGFLLTSADVAALARAGGSGLRRGERRFALRCLLEQAPAETLSGLAAHARAWAARHEGHNGLSGPATARFWAGRAAVSAAVLATLAEAAAGTSTPGPPARSAAAAWPGAGRARGEPLSRGRGSGPPR